MLLPARAKNFNNYFCQLVLPSATTKTHQRAMLITWNAAVSNHKEKFEQKRWNADAHNGKEKFDN
jgi:hypothetical protein